MNDNNLRHAGRMAERREVAAYLREMSEDTWNDGVDVGQLLADLADHVELGMSRADRDIR